MPYTNVGANSVFPSDVKSSISKLHNTWFSDCSHCTAGLPAIVLLVLGFLAELDRGPLVQLKLGTVLEAVLVDRVTLVTVAVVTTVLVVVVVVL